jgi:hypothetical protein
MVENGIFLESQAKKTGGERRKTKKTEGENKRREEKRKPKSVEYREDNG